MTLVREARLVLPFATATRAYITGLFDGEGCITRTNGHPIVQIGMTDEGVIRWLHEIGGTVRTEDGPGRGNRKPLYRWRLLASADVEGFLRAIFPHLRVKQAQAEEAIVEIQGRWLFPRDELLALEHRFTQEAIF